MPFNLLCDPEVHDKLVSPDETKKAVAFEVDFGATTPFNTQVSISSVGDNLAPDLYRAYEGSMNLISGGLAIPCSWSMFLREAVLRRFAG